MDLYINTARRCAWGVARGCEDEAVGKARARLEWARGMSGVLGSPGAGGSWVGCSSSASAPESSTFGYGTLVENRLEVVRHLADAGIEARPLLAGNIGRQPFWIKRYGETRLPRADAVHDHGLYLPNHAALREADIERVARAFRAVARPLAGSSFADAAREGLY